MRKQRHHRIPSADLPNFRKLSLCLRQYLADYCNVPIGPGCNVSTTQSKMWHFSFLTGLHFLPVIFFVTLLGTGVYGICYRGVSQLVPPWQSHSLPQAPVPEAVSTRAVGLKATHSPHPLVWQMCKFISWFNHLLRQNCSLQTAATCKHLPLCLQGNLNPHQLPWIFLFKEPDKWPQRYITWPCTSVHLVASCHSQLSFMQIKVWFPFKSFHYKCL